MQASLINFIFGLAIGLMVAFLAMTYTTGPTSLVMTGYKKMYQREKTALLQVKDPGDDHDLTLEDLAKIQKYVKPVEFKDEHAHHGRCCLKCGPSDLETKILQEY